MATSLATRTRFPELVVQEEKRVRFVVVNGLSIIEKPNNIGIDDADWYAEPSDLSTHLVTLFSSYSFLNMLVYICIILMW